MEKHVNSVCRSCYAQLRHIGHIRQQLTIDATKSLVNSLETSRIYCCTSLLNGIPKTTLNKIQNVQNTAARLITRTSRRGHITPVLNDLHWLPIQFKIRVITNKALQCQSPPYVSNLLQVYKPTRNLRSQNNATALVLPKSYKVMFGDNSFANAAPKRWKESETLAQQPFLKNSLKTHFFIQIYRQ